VLAHRVVWALIDTRMKSLFAPRGNRIFLRVMENYQRHSLNDTYLRTVACNYSSEDILNNRLRRIIETARFFVINVCKFLLLLLIARANENCTNIR
jgi:hypothetical protein